MSVIGNGLNMICNKAFANKRNLMVHSRSHRNDRREKCKFCHHSFCDPSTLKNHIKNVHCEVIPKQFICKLCHKKFARKYPLQKHLETHSNYLNRKLFQCTQCDKSFTFKSNRTRHNKKFHPFKDINL
eukprot:234219_1